MQLIQKNKGAFMSINNQRTEDDYVYQESNFLELYYKEYIPKMSKISLSLYSLTFTKIKTELARFCNEYNLDYRLKTIIILSTYKDLYNYLAIIQNNFKDILTTVIKDGEFSFDAIREYHLENKDLSPAFYNLLSDNPWLVRLLEVAISKNLFDKTKSFLHLPFQIINFTLIDNQVSETDLIFNYTENRIDSNLKPVVFASLINQAFDYNIGVTNAIKDFVETSREEISLADGTKTKVWRFVNKAEFVDVIINEIQLVERHKNSFNDLIYNT